MEKPTIGIRQADGSFYEIMGDAQSGHKRLVLSAARSDQHGVRIDLFRSLDGQADPEGALGSISLDDPQGLGYQDIEFRVDLDAEGQLTASAALPGQAPRTLTVDLTPFRASAESWDTPADPMLADLDLDSGPMTLDLPDAQEDEAPRRSDSDILADETFALADLDTLDDHFSTETEDEPAPADAPFDLPDAEDEAPRRSDSDILEDEAFASVELDTLDDFSFDDTAGGTPETRGLDDLGEAESFDMPEMAEDPSPASFDLGDLDAGFGDDPVAPGSSDEPEPGNPAEQWEKISLDDMEPMEFLDTGAEISAPSKVSASKPSDPKKADTDTFRMDDDEPLELGDFDSDLSDLPDLGDMGDSSPSFPASDRDGADNDLDMDFLAPPALTEPSPWDGEDPGEAVPVPAKDKGKKKGGAAKEPKAEKAPPSAPGPRNSGESSIDKMALMLSLAALSLLVLLILVLLFLNMIKAPQPPVIQPEVQRWKATSALASSQAPAADTLDLGATEPVVLEAETVLEVPATLKSARVSLVLEPGETVEDAARRFGEPARVQGNQLSW